MKIPEHKNDLVRTQHNSIAQFSKCVGYCKYHDLFVTFPQLIEKKCLSKNCEHFTRLPHSFWDELTEKQRQKLILQESLRQIDINKNKDKNKPKRKERIGKYFLSFEIYTGYVPDDKQVFLQGLKKEIIQISALLLDSEYNKVSQKSILVRPQYAIIPNEPEKTGFTKQEVLDAGNFNYAILKIYKWLRNADLITYCWDESTYKQLFDESKVKLGQNEDLFSFYKTFISLKESLINIIDTKEEITIDYMMKLIHAQPKSIQNNASVKCFRVALILHKVTCAYTLQNKFLYKYIATENNKYICNTKFNDYTSSIAETIGTDVIVDEASKNTDEETLYEIEEKIEKDTEQVFYNKMKDASDIALGKDVRS